MDGAYERDTDGSLWRLLPAARIDASLADLSDALIRPVTFGDGRQQPVTGVRMRISPEEGRGVIDLFRVSPHLFVMKIEAIYDEDREILVPGDRMIKLRFLLAGRLKAVGSDLAIDGAGAYLEAYPGEVASSYILSGKRATRLLVLHCAPSFFTESIAIPVAELPPPLNHVFAQASGAPRSAIAPLGPDLLRAANDMFRSNTYPTPRLRNAYLDAKSREIACSVVGGLAAPRESFPALSVRDVNRLYEARDILADQFRTPPKIAGLARQVGLNQTKLKAAFKTVFDITISDFIVKTRMERGSELLASTRLSISEIAYATGYAYPANFAHAFKRFYGHAPRQSRRAATTAAEPKRPGGRPG
ncbi:MAG TPA: AraC family transcriptional regulator [Rhizomicrobium sp.]